MHTFSPTSGSSSLQSNLRFWLASWNFLDNPFGVWDAGRESGLEKYFVEPPLYEQLLGSYNSTLLFAPRGGGKSAMRIMIQSECRPASMNSPVLAVPFVDFSPLVENPLQPQSLSLQNYLPYLLRECVHTLLKASIQIDQEREILDKDLSELRFWIECYARHLLTKDFLPSLIKEIAPTISTSELDALIVRGRVSDKLHRSGQDQHLLHVVSLWKRLAKVTATASSFPQSSPSQTIRAFIQFSLTLLTRVGFPCERVFLLIDGIDEYALTQSDPQNSASILAPLLSNLHFLEIPGLVVKFFLPLEQEEVLKAVSRIDRLEVHSLIWRHSESSDIEKIQQLLRKRIVFFNTSGLQSLAELCASGLRSWIEDELIKESAGSPRNLLRLGNQVFVEHCRQKPTPESEITIQDWDLAIQWYRGNVFVSDNRSTQSRSAKGTSNAKRSHALELDIVAGKVFVSGKEVLPPLADLEFKLLVYLYRRKGQICTREEIILAVYGRDMIVTEEMLSSLIYRVRKKIGQSKQSNNHFIHSVARGYRLENTV